MARTIGSEEDLISRYLASLASAAPGAHGLSDDCATVRPAHGHELVVTTDAVVAGIHFFADETPENIAWRALAVNVSNLAAKGADPLCYMMALSLPEVPTDEWMMRFASALKDAQDRYGMTLIGGDTDHRAGSPLSITITAMGEVKAGQMVLRSTAGIGDRVFVSGTLGDAAIGLEIRRNTDTKRFPELDKDQRQFLLDRYLRPEARTELSALLLKRASAAMDISDGLVKDLGRLCKASKVAARVQLANLPLSVAGQKAMAAHVELADAPMNGGDDYEIIAVVPPKEAASFEEAALEAGLAVTDIGEIVKGDGVTLIAADGQTVKLAKSGYDHFDPLHKFRPQSMTMVCAVIAVWAARKTMAAAMSVGSTSFFRAVFSTLFALRSAGHGSVQGVRVRPGATALTRTSGASALARLRVRLMSPALLAA